MAYTPQVTLFPGDVGRYLKGQRVVDITNLLSLQVNKSLLLLYVTGADDPNCTWVEADNIDMKPLAGCRVKLHLQVPRGDAQRAETRHEAPAGETSWRRTASLSTLLCGERSDRASINKCCNSF